MGQIDEKRAFSKRLIEALRRMRIDISSPTRIAREFNLRYHGEPITAQAVRKWLGGSSIPSQERVRVLATWLNVSAQWLRFGESDSEEDASLPPLSQEIPGYVLTPEVLLKNFDHLSDHHKRVVVEIIHALQQLQPI